MCSNISTQDISELDALNYALERADQIKKPVFRTKFVYRKYYYPYYYVQDEFEGPRPYYVEYQEPHRIGPIHVDTGYLSPRDGYGTNIGIEAFSISSGSYFYFNILIEILLIVLLICYVRGYSA